MPSLKNSCSGKLSGLGNGLRALVSTRCLSLWLPGKLEHLVAIQKTRWVLRGFWRGAFGMTNGQCSHHCHQGSKQSIHRRSLLLSPRFFCGILLSALVPDAIYQQATKYRGRLKSTSWRKNLPMFPTTELAPLHHKKTSVTTSENNSYIPAGSFTRIGEIKRERKITKTSRKCKPNELHCNGTQNREEGCPLLPSSL